MGDGTTYVYGSTNKSSDCYAICHALVLCAPATSIPILKRNEHFYQIHPVIVPTDNDSLDIGTIESLPKDAFATSLDTKHSGSVSLDPDNVLFLEMKATFCSLLDEHDSIFELNIDKLVDLQQKLLHSPM